MEIIVITCSRCGAKLDESAESTPCQNCGTAGRNISIFIGEAINAHDLMPAKSTSLSLSGKKYLRYDVISGRELHRKSGKWYRKDRIIDKDNDYYYEYIVDPENGEVVHECEERLSDHRNHGSAKLRKDA